jgi:omega-6 fatty acid desaturase (delta-12 desaturase)
MAWAVALYALTFVGATLCPSWPLRIFFGLLNGFAIAGLFVVGHDACHGSLTPSERLNRLLGRIALLPSLHPAAAWVHSHNGMHHGWTNLRGKDPVYVPFSKAEFDVLPPLRRAAERVYRTTSGIALFYLVEIWWKHLMFPADADHPRGKATGTFRRDRALVLAFVAAELAFAVVAPPTPLGPITAAASVLVAVVLPFLVWNWVMAFATFQHHTHPAVPWYDREEDWSFFAGQVESSVRVRLPWFMEKLLHNIMDHTAHHVDPKIPLYNLPAQQTRLEVAFANEIVIEPWNLLAFARTLRKCKLYDYESHRWMTFDGTPTTDRLLLPRAKRTADAA